jgi:integrase
VGAIGSTPDLKFRKAKAGSKPYKIADRDGLYLFVSRKGAKSWRFDYRLSARRQTLTIGRFPDVGLAVARKRLDEARGLVAAGMSPAEQKQMRKLEDRLAAKNTLQARAEEWYQAKAPRMSKSWCGNARRWLDGDIYPALGPKPIRNVTVADIEALVKSMAKKRGGKSAFYARLLLADVFKAQPRALNLGNPARDLGNTIEIAKGEPKGKPLPVREIPNLLKALDAYPGRPQTRLAILLLLYTFTRKLELIEVPWSEIDLDRGEWTVAPDRMKMDKPHVVPLSIQAVEWFKNLRELAGASPYVFPSMKDEKRPMSGSTLNHALFEIGFAHFTPHSARSTASTELNKQGWSVDAIELQLAHIEKNKTRASYNYADRMDERRKMMQAWADFLDGVSSGADVVPIRRTA